MIEVDRIPEGYEGKNIIKFRRVVMKMKNKVYIFFRYDAIGFPQKAAIGMNLNTLEAQGRRRNLQPSNTLVFRSLNFRPKFYYGKAPNEAWRQNEILSHA